jgi:hypothetical protein
MHEQHLTVRRGFPLGFASLRVEQPATMDATNAEFGTFVVHVRIAMGVGVSP